MPAILIYHNAIMADLAAGYYWHHPDINLAIHYRGYQGSAEAFGAVQELQRRSIGLELTKYLFDYQGFAPFAGPVVSYERLSFTDRLEDQAAYQVSDTQFGYGLTLGWDIRPTHLQTFLLRTNVRWFPGLKLTTENNTSVSFSNIEFNFIQLILFPNRLF